jgi:ABC-type multidrug transport system ATPase subunit
MIAGLLAPSTGTIIYEEANHQIEVDQIFRKLSISAPYLELVEELTLEEHFAFQQQFKPLLYQLSIADAIAITQLKPGSSKQIRNYSSGMKQRLKVALAVLSDVPLLLLDEPTTNLDEKGVAWYVDLMKKFGGDRLIIVCSNVAREYSFCSQKIEVLDFK